MERDSQGPYIMGMTEIQRVERNEILRKQNGNAKAGVQFGVTGSTGHRDG